MHKQNISLRIVESSPRDPGETSFPVYLVINRYTSSWAPELAEAGKPAVVSKRLGKTWECHLGQIPPDSVEIQPSGRKISVYHWRTAKIQSPHEFGHIGEVKNFVRAATILCHTFKILGG